MSIYVRHNSRGSVFIIFCLFLVFLVGAISFSFYTGQVIKKKIKLQVATDIAATSMATHTSQGLNMIAANNIAIGASLHVAHAAPLLASHASLFYVAAGTISGSIQEAGSYLSDNVKSNFQQAIWDPLKVYYGAFIRTAGGLTSYNSYLKDYWMYASPFYGMEAARENLPGSSVVSWQKSSAIPLVHKFDGLSQTSPKETLCQTIDASNGIASRHASTNWLLGPFVSAGSATPPIARKLNGLINSIDKYLSIVNPIGFTECGVGLRINLGGFF